MNIKVKKGVLVLEDGTRFDGISIGVSGERIGRVVLNTAVVGYQEMMTDPANAGKILVLTYPLIGNYGVAKKFYESKKVWVEGLIIREKSNISSNWQAEDTFDNFLIKEKTVCMSEADTRTLAVKIRDTKEMLGIISTKESGKEKLLKKLKSHAKKNKSDYIKNISVAKIKKIPGNPSGPKIGVLDLGMPNSFIKQLKDLGCNITLLPYKTDPSLILKSGLDGLVISSGPEEDTAIPQVVESARRLVGKIPILGISAGHEVIAIALGGRVKRMRIGHHGVNYPVAAPSSNKGDITVQNHSFVVDESSLDSVKDVNITLRNLNDKTIEEMESPSLKFISTQYYPASPGFNEVNEVFKRFLNMSRGRRQKSDERNRVCQNART